VHHQGSPTWLRPCQNLFWGRKLGKWNSQQTTKTLPNRFALPKKKTRRPANIRAQTQTPVPNPSARHDSRGKLLRACLIKGGKVCAAREGVALRQQQGGRGGGYCREEKSAGAAAAVAGKKRRRRRQAGCHAQRPAPPTSRWPASSSSRRPAPSSALNGLAAAPISRVAAVTTSTTPALIWISFNNAVLFQCQPICRL
jgi:hypothetical protein